MREQHGGLRVRLGHADPSVAIAEVGLFMQVPRCIVGRVQEPAQEGVVRLNARLRGIVGQAVEFETLQQAVV